MNAPELNAWDATKAIMLPRSHRSFVLPNYTPSGWWECDVFEVTGAGYFVEYEIKMTVSDFKKDAAKRKSAGWVWNEKKLRREPPESRPTKHALLAAASPTGPSRFYFVTPPGMIAIEHRELLDPAAVLPTWAGLIEIEWRCRSWYARTRVPAPRLHRQKVRPALEKHARGVCYYRMHRCFQKENS